MRMLILAGVVSITPLFGAVTAPPAPGQDTPDEAAWRRIVTLGGQLEAAKDKSAQIAGDRQMLAATKAFMAQFPDSPHAPNARLVWAQSAQDLDLLGVPDAPPAAEVARTFDALAADPRVPEAKRAEIQFVQIDLALRQAAGTPSTTAETWLAIDGKIAAFGKEFGEGASLDGQTSALMQLRGLELEGLTASNGPATQAVLKKLSSNPNPQIAQMAQVTLAAAQLRAGWMGQAPKLSFKAVDGTAVEVAKLKGKVVLIDFWATWCAPCVAEMPDVVAAYQKLHDQGFEIVGISLDQDTATLNAFTKEAGMTWPQTCDGQSFDGPLPKKYGIDGIPAMWLVDKSGMIVSQNGQDDLAGQVQKLLKAP